MSVPVSLCADAVEFGNLKEGLKLPIERGLRNEAEKAPAQAVPKSMVALRQI